MTISLEKRSEAALISLQKIAEESTVDLGNVSAQVKLVIDYSESMEWPENLFYTNGDMQELSEAVLGLSMTGLDEDKNVQVYPFHTEVFEPFTVDEKNYSGAIDRWRNPKGLFKAAPKMGGTYYLPVIDRIVADASYAGDLEPGKPPVLVIFQTDGQTYGMQQVKQRLIQLSGRSIFWLFLGLGNKTEFLEELDDMPGRVIDNVGFAKARRIIGLPPEQLYTSMLQEFLTKWLPEARSQGIVRD